MLPRCLPRGKSASQLSLPSGQPGDSQWPKKHSPWASPPLLLHATQKLLAPSVFCVSTSEHVKYLEGSAWHTARCCIYTCRIFISMHLSDHVCICISFLIDMRVKAELCEAVEWEAASVHNGWWFALFPPPLKCQSILPPQSAPLQTCNDSADFNYLSWLPRLWLPDAQQGRSFGFISGNTCTSLARSLF